MADPPDHATGSSSERLLLTELEQNYSWMQELLKHLLAWYAFFFTTNVALLGYLTKDPDPLLGPLPYLMLFLDACGAVLIVVAFRYFRGADARARSLVAQVNRLAGGEVEMRSVFPLRPLSIGLLFLGFGLLALAVVWTILAR